MNDPAPRAVASHTSWGYRDGYGFGSSALMGSGSLRATLTGLVAAPSPRHHTFAAAQHHPTTSVGVLPHEVDRSGRVPYFEPASGAAAGPASRDRGDPVVTAAPLNLEPAPGAAAAGPASREDRSDVVVAAAAAASNDTPYFPKMDPVFTKYMERCVHARAMGRPCRVRIQCRSSVVLGASCFAVRPTVSHV